MSDDARRNATTYVSRRSNRGPARVAGKPAPARRRKAPPRRRPDAGGPADRTPTRAVRPYAIAASVAAGWSVIIGLLLVGVPTLLVWAFAAHAGGGTDGAVQASAAIWLAAHHVPLHLAEGTLGLLPLGLVLVPAALLRLAGGWAARTLAPAGPGDVAALVLPAAALYGLLGGIVAAVADDGVAAASPWSAAAWCAALAALVLTWTALRTAGSIEDLRVLVPAPLRDLVASASAAVLVLLGVGALLVSGSLALHHADVAAVADELDTGFAGGLALLLAGVVYLPNLVVWATAYCVGPGFSVGTATSVSMSETVTGPMPAFPLLAAVPGDSPGSVAWLCLLAPLAAGVAAGLLAHRRGAGLRAEAVAARAAAAGVLGGLMLGVLAWFSAGSLGDQQLSSVGPAPVTVALIAAVELAMVAALVGWLLAWRAERHTP